MNFLLVKNKYLNALLLLMLTSAAVHLVAVICMAVITSNVSYVNYFNILQLGNVIPWLTMTAAGNIVSFAAVILLYGIVLIIQPRHPNV